MAMTGLIFTVFISIGLPLGALLYALLRKGFVPYLLGVVAFVVSQPLMRIPILQFLGENTDLHLYSMTQPILFSIALGLSAGVFEELARYIMMRFFMKERTWQTGLLFGLGHGGIEAVLFVGLSTLSFLLSATTYPDLAFLGGIERIFAMLLHIGLSLLVLQAVVEKKFHYVGLAILIHGLVNATVGIAPFYVSRDVAIFVIEGVLAVSALTLFMYCLSMKRKGVLR
jgi:uncharacterized membrane protein YhfC